MKAWEIYTADLFGEHPCVLVSCQARIGAKPGVVVLDCRTMRPANKREPRAVRSISKVPPLPVAPLGVPALAGQTFASTQTVPHS